jgi:DNA-binding NarL/FixJ family response regulator
LQFHPAVPGRSRRRRRRLTKNERKRRPRKPTNGRLPRGASSVRVAQLVNAGVSAFIQKGTSALEFLATIRSVARGATVLPSPSTGVAGIESSAGLPLCANERPFGLVRLTRRERDVAALIAAGLTRKRIARKLRMGAGTFDRHVRRIQQKISVHSRPGSMKSRDQLIRKN